MKLWENEQTNKYKNLNKIEETLIDGNINRNKMKKANKQKFNINKNVERRIDRNVAFWGCRLWRWKKW